jgi:hypothetical protein
MKATQPLRGVGATRTLFTAHDKHCLSRLFFRQTLLRPRTKREAALRNSQAASISPNLLAREELLR